MPDSRLNLFVKKERIQRGVVIWRIFSLPHGIVAPKPIRGMAIISLGGFYCRHPKYPETDASVTLPTLIFL